MHNSENAIIYYCDPSVRPTIVMQHDVYCKVSTHVHVAIELLLCR